MKANTLRGGQDSELSRLKLLGPGERAEVYKWRHEEQPTPTNAELRRRIRERFGIALKRDGQLSDFWPWQRRQAQWDRLGEMSDQDEVMLEKKYPGISRERLREATIKRMYAVADLEEDPGFGLRVVATDLKEQRASFDRERYQDSLKSKLQLALDELALAFKKSPEAMKLYGQARAMIETTKG